MSTYNDYIDGTYGKPQKWYPGSKAFYILSKTVNFANKTLDAGNGDVLRVLEIPPNIYVLNAWLEVITACAANASVDLGDGTDVDFFGNGLFLDATGFVATALTGSATWDAGNLADEAEEVKEVTVNGAALGDYVIPTHNLDVADLTLTAAVTAADTVTAQLSNLTGGAINLASTTLEVNVLKSVAAISGGKYYTSADTIDLKATTDGADVDISSGVVAVKALCMDMRLM